MRKIPARIAKAIVAANVPTSLPPGRKFLVIGPHVWGKADTITVVKVRSGEGV